MRIMEVLVPAVRDPLIDAATHVEKTETRRAHDLQRIRRRQDSYARTKLDDSTHFHGV